MPFQLGKPARSTHGSPPSLMDEMEGLSEAERTARHQRQIEQARLDWIMRPSLAGLLRVRYQRLYRTTPLPSPAEEEASQKKLAEWTALLRRPDQWTTAATWWEAAEKAEALEAELWAIGQWREVRNG